MTEYQFQQEASKIINSHKEEFSKCLINNQKLMAVKLLKDYTGQGLKECKEVIDLYFLGELKSYSQEERKMKLERLARLPLVVELVTKLKSISEDDLQSLLMKLTLDELLSIDEFLPESEEII
jgi:hypothetical protein